MKMKLWVLFSLMNLLCLASFYGGLLQPLLEEHQQLFLVETTQQGILLAKTQELATLKQSLKHFALKKTPSLHQFTQTLLKLAKKNGLSIKHVEPMPPETPDKKSKGLAIQTSGSYENSLKFIFDVNQLPFLLHWSTITLVRMNTEVELSANITKNE